jgi:hypothetical protein
MTSKYRTPWPWEPEYDPYEHEAVSPVDRFIRRIPESLVIHAGAEGYGCMYIEGGKLISERWGPDGYERSELSLEEGAT